MVNFSIFGSHDGQLHPQRGIYIAVFGGMNLSRPPVASRFAELKLRPDTATLAQYFFFVLFGGADVRWPTLATEFLALREAVLSGTLTLADWDRLAARFGENGGLRTGSFALFGAIHTDKLPSEEEELDDIGLQRHTGSIPQAAVDRLMLAIGHSGPQRLAAVRQAVAEILQPAGRPA